MINIDDPYRAITNPPHSAVGRDRNSPGPVPIPFTRADTERHQGVEDGIDGRAPRLDSDIYLKGYATGIRHANFLRSLYNEGCVS